MMRRFVVLLAALVLPVQASALSCLAPSVQRTFNEVHAAPETYVVVRGRLTLDPRKLPRNNHGNSKPAKMTQVPAKLIGKSMSKSGFVVPFENTVMLEVACYGPWCGSVANGQETLAFVKRDAGSYALGINPCGGRAFTNPSAADLKKVLGCFNGAACDAP